MDELIQHSRELISAGKLEEAVSALKESLKGTVHYDAILLQEARLADLREKIIAGEISSEEVNITTNQITKSVLIVLTQWEKGHSDPEREKETGSTAVGDLVDESLIQDIAVGYKKAIRFYFGIAIIPLLIGIPFFFLYFFGNNAEGVLQPLAGTLIASLSAFPIMRIANRREKLEILNVLVKKIVLLKANPSRAEIDRINEVFWGLMDHSLSKPGDK